MSRRHAKKASFAAQVRAGRRADNLAHLGLRQRGRALVAFCIRCGCDYEICCDESEFDPSYSYCFGSDRCTP